MSDKPVPELSRSKREAETRESTARRKHWAPPSRLDAPEAPPGYKHRWIRAETAGQEDRINVTSKLREGYELVRAEEYPEFDSVVSDGKNQGVISVGDLLLARIPEETADERREYYQSRTHDQMRAADNDLMKANAHSTMKINAPERRSRVSLGGPNWYSD